MVDVVWLVDWFENFATTHGQVAPLRVRWQKTINGEVTRYVKDPLQALASALHLGNFSR